MRYLVGSMLCLLVVMPLAAGCSPAVPPEELGTVLEELPEIPGTYELPKPDPPAVEGDEEEEPDAGQ